MLLMVSPVCLSRPVEYKPTRKERRTIQIGDTLQKAFRVADKPLTWIDVTKIENEVDLAHSERTARFCSLADIAYRVVGVRAGKRYSVAGHGIGKPA